MFFCFFYSSMFIQLGSSLSKLHTKNYFWTSLPALQHLFHMNLQVPKHFFFPESWRVMLRHGDGEAAELGHLPVTSRLPPGDTPGKKARVCQKWAPQKTWIILMGLYHIWSGSFLGRMQKFDKNSAGVAAGGGGGGIFLSVVRWWRGIKSSQKIFAADEWIRAQ